eukprot:4887247-Ditylum_brightwellii.AAC.1
MFCKSSVCCKDPGALSLELSLKTKGFRNLACGCLATGNQQYVVIFSSAIKLQATGRQACRDCPLTHPAGWKCTMTCANFKPLKSSVEELVECLKGVEHSETKNPLERNNWNNNNSSAGLKKTKKGKRKHDKDKKSQDITDNNARSKKSHKHCKLCKMFGGIVELHTTDCCNKKNLLSGLLDGHKKKCFGMAKKEDFCIMVKAFKKATIKGKKAHKRSYHNSSESDSSLEEEWFTFKLNSLRNNSLAKLADNVNQVTKKTRLVKLLPELVATIISETSNRFIAKGKD